MFQAKSHLPAGLLEIERDRESDMQRLWESMQNDRLLDERESTTIHSGAR